MTDWPEHMSATDIAEVLSQDSDIQMAIKDYFCNLCYVARPELTKGENEDDEAPCQQEMTTCIWTDIKFPMEHCMTETVKLAHRAMQIP